MALAPQLPVMPKPQSAHTSDSVAAHGKYTTRTNSTHGLLGREVEFEDGSCWKMTKALSPGKYQQAEPPFEARQIFECLRQRPQ